MKVTVFDYGAGNLHSLAKALVAPGIDLRIEEDPRRAAATDALVLPGVGAFAAAAGRIAPARDALRSALLAGLPCLGICLGMQLLFAGSDEGEGQGLAVIEGRVERLRARRVPHMGWNAIEDATDPLLARSRLDLAYFAHGFVCRAASAASVVGWTRHETERFAAAVRRGHTVGVQFHPEKSSEAGLRFLQAWLTEAAAAGRAAGVAAQAERS
jgi:glutamine amidotransferase